MKIKIKGQTYQEIFESVRSLIASGELEEGCALPPVRELAQEVGVNRNTVAGVYQRLVKAGLAETKYRLGTRVKARQTAGQHDGVTETQLVDLADGNLKREWLPDLNQVAQQSNFKQFVYGESPILPEMEEFGRGCFKADCPEEMGFSITGGAVDSLERLLATHLLPGDKIAVEDPCYLGSANAIQLASMVAVGANMDGDGMLPDELEAHLKKERERCSSRLERKTRRGVATVKNALKKFVMCFLVIPMCWCWWMTTTRYFLPANTKI